MLKISLLKSFIVIISILLSLSVCSQDNPFDVEYYNFIHYDKNNLEFYGSTKSFETLFDTFNKLAIKGKGKISVVHFGGSHIQAGALPSRLSDKLQHFVPGLDAGRGFILPYSMAKTNGPRNYSVTSTGSWQNCLSTDRDETCLLGVSGIKVFTSSVDASITFTMRHLEYLPDYNFTVAKIFHNTDSASYIPLIDSTLLVSPPIVNTRLGYTEFQFKEAQDTLILRLKKNNSTQNNFVLYGISLEHNSPGFIYHGIGLNGASIPSYLRCNLMEQHLTALNSNFYILTLGTNDGYTRKFNPETYYQNYDSLLQRIRLVSPDAAILMTVPNDSYIGRRYLNPNTEKMRDIIRELAKKHNAAVWDFFSVMGGLNSVTLWHEAGLICCTMPY